MMGLIGRPVQARMLADLAIDPEVQWRSFSRYELYQEFIERITEREGRKPTRARLNVQVRRRFIRRVAWWVWGTAGAAGFDIADLPETLLEELQDDVQASIEGIRRDLVSWSILEKKTADTYYFPHRSFLEFLVAEYLCFEQPTQDDLDYFSCSQTAEVRDFIKDSPHAKKIAQWAAHIDGEMEMALGWLELVAWLRNLNGDTLELNALPQITPRQLLVDYLRIVECGAMLDASDYLVDAFRVAKNRQTRIACLVGLLLAQTRDHSSSQCRVLRKQVVALVLSRCLKQFERLSDPDCEPGTVDGDRFLRMVLTAVTSYESAETELVLSVDFPALNRLILQAAVQLGITELNSRLRWDWERDGRVEAFALSELAKINSRLAADQRGAHVVRFFARYPKPRVLLPRDLWSLLD